MVKQRLIIASLLVFIIVSLGFISANTLVAGKICENPGCAVPISGASIHVQCDADYLNTLSLSDGAYAVVFGVDSCAVVNVSSSTHPSPPNDIMKLVMYIQNGGSSSGGNNGGGGGSSSHYYQCGNGICDSGETTGTCPLDCKVNNTNPTAQNLGTELNISDNNQSEKNNSNFLTGSTIAGITEFATSGAGIATGLGLITILIGSIALVNLRKKKVVKNTSGSN